MNDRTNTAQPETPTPDAYPGLIGRLPVTMQPALNQQLSEWGMLFPHEQNRVAIFMKGVQTFSASSLDALVAPLVALEVKMGVKDWAFTKSADTIENASLLARSAYYAAWRKEVQRVFDTINSAASDAAAPPARTRLVLLFLPGNLPVDPQSTWKQWGPRGQEIKISGGSERLCELTMQGQQGGSGIGALAARQGSVDASDLWLIDAETKLGALFSSGSPLPASSLAYSALKPFRDKLLAELNAAPKDIQVTDEVIAKLRSESWSGWGLWPAGFANQPRLRKFAIDLFLSGNGALIFPSPFVQWAASEALRRARPRVLVARFGMRSKPKPFTSIAVFENQQKVSSLPDVDDPVNSAIDGLILARYVWLTAARYPEGDQTICLCVAEHLNSAYLILPEGKSVGWNPARPIAPEELYGWLGTQFLS